jgi:Mg2+ and Co2+ transporter CorA
MRTLFTTGGKAAEASPEAIAECFARAGESGFWLDVEAPGDDDYRLFQEAFKFHPLTIENIQHHDQRPKVDEYPDYNFAVTFQAAWTGDDMAFAPHYLYIGPRYLVSVHDDPSPALIELQNRIARSPELTRGQPGFLTYLIQDALVAATSPSWISSMRRWTGSRTISPRQPLPSH